MVMSAYIIIDAEKVIVYKNRITNWHCILIIIAALVAQALMANLIVYS